MKHFYYLIVLLVLTGCQQQQVPEIFYDLDAQNMASQTRAIQQNVLYKAPIDMLIDEELKIFHGNLTYLERPVDGANSVVEIKVKSDMGVILAFEVSPKVADLMQLEMNLVVRYMRDQNKNIAIEIKKATW